MKALLMVAVAAVAAGCGGSDKSSQYPARPIGCDVKVFVDTPTMPTVNIGPVSATCPVDLPNEESTDESCLHTLRDQVCKLGGDVVWGVSPTPVVSNGKKVFRGRAAHTRDAASTAESPPPPH